MISATTINQIINYISIEGGEYKNIFNKLVDSAQTRNTDVLSDYWQELMLILLEKGEVIVEAYNNNYFKYQFIRIIKNQFHSSTSPSYKKYRRNPENIYLLKYNDDDLEDKKIDEEKIDKIYKFVDENYSWYAAKLFRVKLIEGLSYRQIEKEIGITRNSASATLKPIFDAVKTYMRL